MKEARPAIVATFRDKVSKTLSAFEYVPVWGYGQEFLRRFWPLLDIESREKTDPQSPFLLMAIKESESPGRALQAVERWLNDNPPEGNLGDA